MAECSYARCLQERRLIKRELMKWSKDMLHIVGLERVAEELMGRRKWKQYQETLTRTQLNLEQEQSAIEQQQQQQQFPTNILKSVLITSNNRDRDGEGDRDNLQEEKCILKLSKLETTALADEAAEQNYRQPQQQQQAEQPKENGYISNLAKNGLKVFETIPDSATRNQHLNASQNSSDITSAHAQTLTTTPPPSQSPPEPIDWTPADKCNFCINGRLLTVNAKGELVAESGPGITEQLQQLQHDSDSDSNASLTHTKCRKTGSDNNNLTLNKLLTSRLRDLPANMTSMDSMTAHLAAMQTITHLQKFQNQLAKCQQQEQQQTSSATPATAELSLVAAAISPILKTSPSPSDATGEQPLDLSSKPSPNSSIVGELKSIRTKSACVTPIPSSRHSYSEDDVSNALQDVQDGKLGKRKATALNNVPRSALRNKLSRATARARLSGELETDMSADEYDDSDDAAATLQPAEMQPSYDDLCTIASSAQLRNLCAANNNGSDLGDDADAASVACSSPKLNSALRQTPTSSGGPLPSQTSPQPPVQPMWLDMNVLMQALVIAGVMQPKLGESPTLRDLLLMLNSGGFINETLANAPAAAAIAALNALSAAGGAATANAVAAGVDGPALNNGKSNLLDQRSLLQHLQQQQQHVLAQPSYRHRLPKSDTPETTSSLDPNETCDDPAAILKIPSFKPVAGPTSSSPTLNVGNNDNINSSGSSGNNNSSSNNILNSNSSANRNGDSPHSSSPMLAAAVAAAAGNSTHGVFRPNNSLLSHSPPSFPEVMANRIQRTFNEQANKDAQAAAAAASTLGLAPDSDRNNGSNSGSSCQSDYKKPNITVATMIGGTDTSRFGAYPNLYAKHQQSHAQHPHHHSPHHLSRQEAAALAAGKGTRPKRGKYRNYDRDSLVEAVKAVQRGEMSVHRAGSYYGVPHSTLEYKVKERHLMRPRKREPKPQPGLDGLSSTATSKSNSNIPALNSLDKLKAGSNAASAANSKLSNALKNNSQGAPNGLKMPLFDPQLPYQPHQHMFWPSPAANANFNLDFNRNAAAAAAAAAATQGAATGVGSMNPEFLKTQLQEAMRINAAAAATSSVNSSSPPVLGGGGSSNQSHHSMQMKNSTLEIAESIYDSIIRKKLASSDVGPTNATTVSGGGSGALLDQLLVKKAPPFTNNRRNDYAAVACSSNVSKRAGSPLQSYAAEIKRERASPERSGGSGGSSGSDDDDDATSLVHDESLLEHNNNNSSNKCNNNGRLSMPQPDYLQLQQRSNSRITSRDSETDASSIRSERSNSTTHLQHRNIHHNNNSSESNKMMDLNGATQHEPLDDAANCATSILQKELALIKAEKTEPTEEQL